MNNSRQKLLLEIMISTTLTAMFQKGSLFSALTFFKNVFEIFIQIHQPKFLWSYLKISKELKLPEINSDLFCNFKCF